MTHPLACKQQALQRMATGQRVRTVSRELGVPMSTLRHWRGQHRQGAVIPRARWTPRRKLAAVIETGGMSPDALFDYCNRRRLRPSRLADWKRGFAAVDPDAVLQGAPGNGRPNPTHGSCNSVAAPAPAPERAPAVAAPPAPHGPTYLTADQLAARIHYKPRTIRNQLVGRVLRENVHYIRPFGRRRLLFHWENILRDIAGRTVVLPSYAPSDPPLALDAVAPVRSRKRSRVHVRVRKDSNAVYLDFHFGGRRCREPVGHADRPADLQLATALAARIEEELHAGTFVFDAVFLGRRRRSAQCVLPAPHTPALNGAPHPEMPGGAASV